MDYLKSQHGLDHAAAHRIALVAKSRSSAPPNRASGTDPFADLYTGTKQHLRPVHDVLMSFLLGLGAFDMAPKKGYVSLRRSKQFAMIQPGARWINVGLILPGVGPSGRLESAASFNALFTHRVRVALASDIDHELKGWLRHAYEGAA